MDHAAALPSPFALLLVASVILLVVHIVIQAHLANKDLGTDWNMSARDDGLKPTSSIAGRAERALANYRETYGGFLGLSMALAMSGDTHGVGFLFGVIWLAARVVYIPLYLMGVPKLRSLVWIVALLALFGMAVGVFY